MTAECMTGREKTLLARRGKVTIFDNVRLLRRCRVHWRLFAVFESVHRLFRRSNREEESSNGGLDLRRKHRSQFAATPPGSSPSPSQLQTRPFHSHTPRSVYPYRYPFMQRAAKSAQLVPALRLFEPPNSRIHSWRRHRLDIADSDTRAPSWLAPSQVRMGYLRQAWGAPGERGVGCMRLAASGFLLTSTRRVSTTEHYRLSAGGVQEEGSQQLLKAT